MTALVDASSAIILCKSGLHLAISEMYHLVLSESVYDEITNNPYPGAEEFQQLLADHKITLESPYTATINKEAPSPLNTLGQGEYDVIQLYHSGRGDFIITDDGAAARYCTREQIPFINALLIPMILKCTGAHSDASCLASFKKVVSIGRYSQWIIEFAEQCEREELSFFLPWKN